VPPYFAYGSNLSSERLRERVRSVRAIGVARLDGYAWRSDKRGADGTAKANLAVDASACVWGTLYELDPADLEALDRFEGGYRRVRVVVDCEGAPTVAETYLSGRRCAEAPQAAYLALVLAGAREHDLPANWIAALQELAGAGS
jgi:gamma-glutamylcyclotransferase (GGCT)/AIG2-like uncharacterized protein YtfP